MLLASCMQTGAHKLMRRMALAAAAALGAAAVAALAADGGDAKAQPTSQTTPVSSATAPHPAAQWGFFEQYCEKCHNSTDWAGGVAFDTMSPEGIGDDAKIWEEAVRKLRGRLMP